jgi:hypothetical protein
MCVVAEARPHAPSPVRFLEICVSPAAAVMRWQDGRSMSDVHCSKVDGVGHKAWRVEEVGMSKEQN